MGRPALGFSTRLALRSPLTLFLVLLALACGAPRIADAQAPPPAVGVQAAEIRGVARAYNFIGRIGAINIAQLRARVEGFLDKILFTEGQDVKTGDLLFQIEQAPYQAQVDAGKANVAQLQAQHVNAKLTLDRAQALLHTPAGQQSTVDAALAAEQSLAAQIDNAKAQLETAQINLGYTEIRAPIDGRIGRFNYTLGNLVNPASGVLATIVSQDPIYVLFPVSERDLENIRAERHQENGSQIKIEILVQLANGKMYPHPGVWNFTDVQVNQQTDTLLMRATLPNPERQLVDGAFVTVVLKERNEQPRLVIPQAALQLDQAGSFVLVVNPDNKVEIRRVTQGPPSGTDVVISDGLKQGERVIVDGIQKVRPGQVVTATVVPPAKGS